MLDVVEAHKHSSNHRTELLASYRCGCFFCLKAYPPGDITEWVDEIDGVGTTAICPHCGIDSVIGSESGFPIAPDFLAAMKAHWFEGL